MAMTYERYRKLNINFSRIGLGCSGSENNYFCTPKGAKVIGWAGVDGIHYCFVHGFGEMVFAVSPMNTPGNYVNPLARNFRDFLRLLLACGDAAVLEQVSCWDQTQYDVFLKNNPLTAEQRDVLDVIREKLVIEPMEQPFRYIKELQDEFDYGRIKFTEDYYEWIPAEPKVPEWKVFFDGNFWGHQGGERAGRKIFLNKKFVWGGEVWFIPAIYTCSKGLVADFCVKVPAERIRSFIDKWNLSVENDGTDFTEEQQMLAEAENPLSINMNPRIELNRAFLSCSHSSGLSWNPCFPEENGFEVKQVMQHYDLDPAYGWAIRRAAFPWETKRKPKIKTLSITLMQEPVAVPGPHFHVSLPGERIEFIHPTTGVKHTLTVQEYKQQEISCEHFRNPNQEFPTNYTMMSYLLFPELPEDAFNVTDCVRSDQPRRKRTNPHDPKAISSASVGIIGGADGPTAIFLSAGSQSMLHAACSALHFEQVDDVEWRMVFHEKKREDLTVEINLNDLFTKKGSMDMVDLHKIAPFFSEWQEAMIWSCLQGCMGYAIADNNENPTAALIVNGDICFFGGTPNNSLAVQAAVPIIVPQNEAWNKVIESVFGDLVEKAERYAIKKETDVFDREKLTRYAESLEEGYSLKLIDKEIYDLAIREDWSRDLCSQFADYDDYNKRGIGVAVIQQGKLVSGASSYVVYNGGIEIEIDTKPEFRQKGLATACGARLILECLDRGLYPSWDAHDLRSVSLAEKLGYHLDYPYTVYIRRQWR